MYKNPQNHSRNWKEYNESLVKRGEIILNLDFLKEWDKEINKMNEGKEGRRYLYPNSFIMFLAVIHFLFNLPLRQTEGFINKLKEFIPGLAKPDYSTIGRRINKLKPKLEKTDDKDLVIAVDASGVKVTNRGEWLRTVHKKKSKKGFLKIHFAVDTKKKKILSMKATSDKTGDIKELKPLVNDVGSKRVKKVLADSAYDSRDVFEFLKENGIEAGIKPRKVETVAKGWVDLKGRKPSVKARGSIARKKEVIAYSIDPDGWKEEKEYGMRWMVETVFSVFKRMFGEYARSKKFEYMIKEMIIKAHIYNCLLELKSFV